MFSLSIRAAALALLSATLAHSQTAEPVIRQILKTDTSFVLGVVEPASGRFIAYMEGRCTWTVHPAQGRRW